MTTAAMDRTTPHLQAESAGDRMGAPHSSPVMRQTQALMGVILLAGAAGACFVDMAWITIPFIIGGGLVFAGASGMCPMASLMARMPWNRAAGAGRRAEGGSCCGGDCDR